MLDLWFVKVNSFQISKVDAILCKPQNRKLGSEWGRMWTLGHHVWRWTLFRLRMWMPYCANPQNRKPGSEWRRMCTVGQPEWIRHPFRFRFWRPYCANRKTGNSEVNGKQCVHEASLFKCEFHSDSNAGGHVVQTAKPETLKWKGISMRMHQLAWTFAKTYGASCLCHGEGSSYHSIGEVNTNQVGVKKTIFWNQIAHGEASLQWCQILAFLWIVVLFCMGALGGCVALGPLWRFFNLKIFFSKNFPTFPMGLTNVNFSS